MVTYNSLNSLHQFNGLYVGLNILELSRDRKFKRSKKMSENDAAKNRKSSTVKDTKYFELLIQ